MMAILKENKVVYEFSLEEVKKLIAADLEVSPENIQVEYVLTDVSDDRFEMFPRYKVTSIKVVVQK